MEILALLTIGFWFLALISAITGFMFMDVSDWSYVGVVLAKLYTFAGVVCCVLTLIGALGIRVVIH